MILIAVRTDDGRILGYDRLRGVTIRFEGPDDAERLQQVWRRCGPDSLLVGFPPHNPAPVARVPGTLATLAGPPERTETPA